MFEVLFARIADRYRLVAPDYPGFGHSDWPDPKTFPYTFDRIAEVMNHFTEKVGLRRHTVLHARLWRSRRFSHGAGPRRANRSAHRAKRAGHFALDTAADAIAELVRSFADSVNQRPAPAELAR